MTKRIMPRWLFIILMTLKYFVITAVALAICGVLTYYAVTKSELLMVSVMVLLALAIVIDGLIMMFKHINQQYVEYITKRIPDTGVPKNGKA